MFTTGAVCAGGPGFEEAANARILRSVDTFHAIYPQVKLISARNV